MELKEIDCEGYMSGLERCDCGERLVQGINTNGIIFSHRISSLFCLTYMLRLPQTPVCVDRRIDRRLSWIKYNLLIPKFLFTYYLFNQQSEFTIIL
jgi:hypothetical protein